MALETVTQIRSARQVVENEIDRLIMLLDALDGDADFEPDSDAEEGGDAEPSLGWCDGPNGTFIGADDDLEAGYV